MSEETLWLWLDRYGILLGDLLMTLTMLAAMAGFIRRNDLRRWLRRNHFGQVGTDLPPEQHYDALLIPISKPDVPNWLIDRLHPTRLVLFATPQSGEAARQVAEHARSKGIKDIAQITLDSADDTAAFRARAAQHIRHLMESGTRDIAVDTTGGKVPMSLGLFMAAEEAGLSSLYVSSEFDPQLKRPRLDSARIITLSQSAS
jgi:hypothetical protein